MELKWGWLQKFITVVHVFFFRDSKALKPEPDCYCLGGCKDMGSYGEVCEEKHNGDTDCSCSGYEMPMALGPGSIGSGFEKKCTESSCAVVAAADYEISVPGGRTPPDFVCICPPDPDARAPAPAPDPPAPASAPAPPNDVPSGSGIPPTHEQDVVAIVESATNEAHTDGPTVRRTIDTSSGPVQVAVRKVSQGIMRNGVKMQVQSTSVDIPSEVADFLAEDEIAVLHLVMHASAEYLSSDASEGLASSPVQMDMMSQRAHSNDAADLKKVAVKGLRDPIAFTMTLGVQPSSATELLCATWNKATQEWTTHGVSSIELNEGSFKCETTHLSSFAVLYKESLMAIACSNLHLFSERGFELLSSGAWIGRTAGIFFSLLLALTVLILALAINADITTARQYQWSDKDFILKVQKPEVLKDLQPKSTKMVIMQKVARKVVCKVVYANMAANANIHPDDMSVAIGQYFANLELTEQMGTSEKLVEHEEFVILAAEHTSRDTLKTALETCLRSTVMARAWLLLLSIHPLLSLKRHSILVSQKMRTLIYVDTLWGAFFISVLFFQSDSVSVDAPKECKKPESPLGRLIAVGLISAVLSSMIIAVIGHLHSRELVYCQGWSDKAVKKLLMRWRILDALYLVLGSVLLVSYSLFVGLFLAQTSDTDGEAFVSASLTSLTKAWAVIPFGAALVLSWLAGTVQWEGTQLRMIEKELGIPTEDSKGSCPHKTGSTNEASGKTVSASTVVVEASQSIDAHLQNIESLFHQNKGTVQTQAEPDLDNTNVSAEPINTLHNDKLVETEAHPATSNIVEEMKEMKDRAEGMFSRKAEVEKEQATESKDPRQEDSKAPKGTLPLPSSTGFCTKACCVADSDLNLAVVPPAEDSVFPLQKKA